MTVWMQKLAEIMPAERIKWQEPMSRHTTFAIGGPADALVVPRTEEELARVIAFCHDERVPRLVIGQGSNLLVQDGGFRGVVIKIDRQLGQTEISPPLVRVGAGMPLSELAHLAAENSLSGLEFAVGIPGSLGGAVVMNAGAYDGEMKELVTAVRVMDEQGKIEERPGSKLNFGYRSSALLGSGLVVVSAVLELVPGNREEIEAKMNDFTERRQLRQPLELPSAGSIFRRPPGRFVGPMIEELGLKGFSVNDAQVSEKHAGFIVNRGKAKARDVLELIAVIKQVVKDRYGIELELEIQVVGEELDFNKKVYASTIKWRK